MAEPAKTHSIEAEAWTALLKPPGSYRAVLLAVATVLLVTITAVVMLGVAVLTLFKARRFYTEVIARGLARAILWMWGVRVVVHRDGPFPETQTIYISNHTSTIDMFVLVGLGLPNARFFWTGFFRKIVPLGVISTLMGTFHTPSQTDRAARVRCFESAERVLRRTGDSVYLSPEGERVTTGRIGHFNKGAFHLATNLSVPIVPLYIDIPPEIDPGKGYETRPGTVHVYIKPPIPTRDWRLQELERNRAQVRDLYVSWRRSLQGQTGREDQDHG